MTGPIAITGTHGLVGQRLLSSLAKDSIPVRRLVRSQSPDPDAIHWDPKSGADPLELEGIHAVVHLAGESLMGRWNGPKKKAILESRAQGTLNLCTCLANMQHPPEVLVSGSAVGFYGNRGNEELTEKSSPGTGFLSEVCTQWEAATEPARDAGIRVVNLRTSVVLDANGGALGQMLPFFKAGLGGRLGNGKQWMPWIGANDMTRLIRHAIDGDLKGPVNAVARSDTNHDFTKALGAALGRPTIFPLPAFAARIIFGEMADALLLSSQHVQATRARASGFTFHDETLQDALPHALGKAPVASAKA